MNPSLVSIIIPCRNAAPWLSECLESAFAQTYPDKEIIFVDDGSTDDSNEIARKYLARGLRLIEGPARNAASARNAGLATSKGNWIQFLDADDLLDPEKIRHQMMHATSVSSKTLLSGAWDRFKNHPLEAVFRTQANWKNLTALEFFTLHWEQCLMMHPAAWLTPRVLIETGGAWNEELTLNDDGEFFARMMLSSDGIVCCPNSRSYYRSGIPGSLSRQTGKRAMESLFRSIELITSRILAQEETSRSRSLCATAWKRTAYDLYPQDPKLTTEAEKRCRSLGGCEHRHLMGPKLNLLSKLIGWKAAKRVHNFISNLRQKGSEGAPVSGMS